MNGGNDPACVECKQDFRMKKGGIDLTYYDDYEKPYEIWRADLWKCPKCGKEIVTGTGEQPLMKGAPESLAGRIEEAKERGILYKTHRWD